MQIKLVFFLLGTDLLGTNTEYFKKSKFNQNYLLNARNSLHLLSTPNQMPTIFERVQKSPIDTLNLFLIEDGMKNKRRTVNELNCGECLEVVA